MTTPSKNILLSGDQYVTDPGLSAQVLETLGWDDTTLKWNIGRRKAYVICGYSRGNPRHARNGEPEDYIELDTRAHVISGESGIVEVRTVPAYDLAFLMRHAPQPVTLERTDEGDWEATVGQRDLGVTSACAATPEDALALACIRAHSSGATA